MDPNAPDPMTPALRDGMHGGRRIASTPFTGFSAVSGITPSVDRSAFLDKRDVPQFRLSGLGSSVKRNGEYFGLREPSSQGSQAETSVDNDSHALFMSNTGKKRGRTSTSSELVLDQSNNKSFDDISRKYAQATREVDLLKRKLMESKLESERRIAGLERDLNRQTTRYEAQVSEVDRANQMERDMVNKLRNIEMNSIQEKHKLNDKIRELEKELRRANSANSEIEATLSVQVTELKNELDYARTVVEEREHQVKTLQLDLENAESRAMHSSASDDEDAVTRLQFCVRKLETENKDLKLQLKAAESGGAVSGRASELNIELRTSRRRESELLKRLEECEREVRQLRDASQESGAAQARLGRLSGQRDALLSIEAERDALAAEKEEWTTLFRRVLKGHAQLKSNENDVPSTNGHVPQDLSPMHALGVLQEFENMCAFLSKKRGSLEVKLTKTSAELSAKEDAARAAKKMLRELQVKHVEVEERLHDLEKRNLFLSKERDSLLRVIDSVKGEAYGTLPKAQQNEAAVKELREAYDRQIEELKKSLAAAHERVSDLENEAKVFKGGASPAANRARTAQIKDQEAELNAALVENKKLANNLEKALDKVAELEHQVANGVYNPSKTRIVHLTQNPERKAMQVAAAMAAKGPDAEGLESAGDPNKRTERLKKIFKETSHAFREAVYLLTGYKVDMFDKGGQQQLRLRSMFAELPGDELIFQCEGSNLALIETPFCKRIDENTFAYLQRCNSVPAFLSTLTLDLFSKQTLALN